MFDTNCSLCEKTITQESQEKSSGGGIISVAEMIDDDNHFTYGISGIFKLAAPTLKKGDTICNDCLKEMGDDKISPAKTVKCTNCGSMYQSCWEFDNAQPAGWGCSSSVYESNRDKDLKLHCGWGSNKDCDVFNIIIPGLKIGDNICDTCIDKYVQDGTLVFEPSLSGH